MSAAHKSEGQRLLEVIVSWFESYLVFPSPHMSVVAALWVINTWVFKAFDAVPYLAVTAETKRAGKTTLLEMCSFLSRNPEKGGMGTAAALYTLMDQYNGQCSLFFDEAERMSSGAVGMMRSFMNSGYRVGETIPRTMPDRTVIKFPCFGPKLYALIGDPEDTLRDRCILFVMRRAASPKPYRPTTAAREAEPIAGAIKLYLRSKGWYVEAGEQPAIPVVVPDWLENRDQEIWEPLWSLAHGLGCDGAMLARIKRASEVLVEGKSAPVRRYSETAKAEDELNAETYGEMVIRDLLSVFREGERGLWTLEAVARLRALSGRWEAYKGVGLNEMTLSNLLSPLGVKPRQLKMGKINRNGYHRADVAASVPRKG